MGDLEQRKRLLPQFKLMRNHVSCDVTASEPDHCPAHQTAVPHDLNRLFIYRSALGYPERIIHLHVLSGIRIAGANTGTTAAGIILH
jgi:hypothetical protein